MSMMAFQITGVSIAFFAQPFVQAQRKHQSSASLAFGGEWNSDRWIPLTKGE